MTPKVQRFFQYSRCNDHHYVFNGIRYSTRPQHVVIGSTAFNDKTFPLEMQQEFDMVLFDTRVFVADNPKDTEKDFSIDTLICDIDVMRVFFCG